MVLDLDEVFPATAGYSETLIRLRSGQRRCYRYAMPDTRPPEEKIILHLSGMQKTIATAESCTGGLLAHRLTNVPGASTPFLGGVVAYNNTIKTAFLDVPDAILSEFGAVSEATATAMAEGARDRFGADFAISVTGIAGPGGGTPEKPVGLVYMAVAHAAGTAVFKHQFTGNRVAIKAKTADTALDHIWEIVYQ